MRGDGRIAHPHGRDLGEGGLQRGEQLTFELGIDPVARVGLLDVAAHVLVEHERVGYAVRVLAVAAHRDVDVEPDIGVDDAEGDGRRRAVLVPRDLLRVEEVHALVFGGVPAEREARPHPLERGPDPVGDRARPPEKQTRLARFVEDELPRLAAGVDDGALLDDDHVLPLVDRDDRSVGDDVGLPARVRRPPLVGDALAPLRDKRVGVERVAIKILAPRIRQNAAHSANASLQKSHRNSSRQSQMPLNYVSQAKDAATKGPAAHPNGSKEKGSIGQKTKMSKWSAKRQQR